MAKDPLCRESEKACQSGEKIRGTSEKHLVVLARVETQCLPG
jgi:hypothetical protein